MKYRRTYGHRKMYGTPIPSKEQVRAHLDFWAAGLKNDMAIKERKRYYRFGREYIVTEFARNPRTGILIVIYTEVDGSQLMWREYDEFRKLFNEV